ncbi:MAG: DUF406 family protein [Psychromonas sp.]|nr:DUF406 family protein [Psychromonas sp.]
MSKVKNNTGETDVYETCGTIVEVGTIISEDDTVLTLPFEGVDLASAEALAKKYVDAARQRFATVKVKYKESTTQKAVTLNLTLIFECAAEKIIFEMALSTI